MASFYSLYNDIEHKIKKAQLQLIDISKENKQLQEEKQLLRNEVERLQTHVKDLEEKIKLMTITQTIIYKEDKTDTKRRITELVREIDNCIGLLNS